MKQATPQQIAVAWATWKSRHGGKLGPGPAFVEAINAALNVEENSKSNQIPLDDDKPVL